MNKYIVAKNFTAELIQLIEADKPQQTEPQPEIWECVDDETPDWDSNNNWRIEDGISKKDRLQVQFKDKEGLWFFGKDYCHDITKFKKITT